MADSRALWLVNNASSGSNDDDALTALQKCCGDHGVRVAQQSTFPAEDLPTPAMLDAAGIDLVAVFAGDGTINATISALSRWGGEVLVLPGGTMNLLFHRLHGDRSMDEVIADTANRRYRPHRPGLARSEAGDALAGVLAGPGTSWNHVREAMRDVAVLDLTRGTVAAVTETLSGDMIACVEPELGRREGYPLLNLTPTDEGLEIRAYHAETPAEYAAQALALAKRNFREGPHEVLGVVEAIRFASVGGSAMGVLIDGEPVPEMQEARFALAMAEVDLIATAA